MRNIFISCAIISLLLQIPCVGASEPAKIKHIATLYADNAGASFKYPEGIACSGKSFVVADTGNSRLVRFSAQAQSFTADAVFPVPGVSPIVAQMNSKGDIYALDGKERRIVKVSSSGELQGSLTPKNIPSPANVVPRSFRIDKKDNIYLLDIFSERVIVVDSGELFVRQIAFPKGYGFFSDLAVNQQGEIYLIDSVKAVVYKASPNATAFEPLSDPLKGLMNFPKGIILDNSGIIYLVDQYGSGLALVGRDGTFLGRKLGMGWEESQLYYPAQICINEQDILFIADRNNNRVQLFNITGNEQ